MITYIIFPTSKAVIKTFIEHCTPNRNAQDKEDTFNILYEEQSHYKGVLFNKSYYTWVDLRERLPSNANEFKYSPLKLSIF